MALYIRAGLHFIPLENRPLHPNDDSTEVCGVRILGERPITIWNLYRPPIRSSEDDDRQDAFAPDALPNDDDTIIIGDFNAHHPQWDYNCDEADSVGQRMGDWLTRVGWTSLNNGDPTFLSYRTGSRTAPDLAACSTGLANRSTWQLGPDLGSDHLPMLVVVRRSERPPHRIRKTRWAFHKANWVGFRDACEATLAETEPEQESVQALSTRLTKVIQEASARFIPKGARSDPKPWALDPELVRAIQERRTARSQVQPGVPATREAWTQAKKNAAEIERRVSQAHFRNFVSKTLNKPASLGKVTKILKKWEGASDEHRAGEAMLDNGKLVITDKEKAEVLNRTYSSVSKQVRAAKQDRAAKQKLKEYRVCAECAGARNDCCSAFSSAELCQQLQRLQMKKAPGPDGICNEHLKYLGPVARETLLRLINASWLNAEVPTEWRRATIVPIPKSGKDRRLPGSYRPIALTSHIAKLAERMIQTRLMFVADQKNMIPPEQVGFRAKRSVADSLGRLIQTVQDGWNRPKARSRNPPDGTTAQKFVLMAFDFARAYDTVDHGLLRVRLLELGVPQCMVNWVWQFLRDRRARVEVNGAMSSERVFRAGLPQGGVLSPALFLLWAAPLATSLKSLPGVTPFMYADDTAVLCAGNTVETAQKRAQQAADALVKWARLAKMKVAGEKTQLLVLSQWARDTTNVAIKVAGAPVAASPQLKLLGVTFDRLLHFGPHCKSLKAKVRPRTAQLRKLTGRTWGLEERTLRTVANGYIRGAIEHAAEAWLPATPPSNAILVERELRAAARAVTGCPRSTPAHAVLAEAGITPVAARTKTLAARFLAKSLALPPDDPLRTVGEATVRGRLTSVTGWREVGRAVWGAAGISPPIEPLLPRRVPPWEETAATISFSLSVGASLPAGASPEVKKTQALFHLTALPQCATWAWTDGSAAGGVLNGGAGAFIEEPGGATHALRAPAGHLCSSFRAELTALQSALAHLIDHPTHPEDPIVICTDSQSALSSLRAGPAEQTTPMGVQIWRDLTTLAQGNRQIHLQWIPSHCGILGNEKADELAKEASALPQEQVPLDVTTVSRAAARAARAEYVKAWPAGWYRLLMAECLPPPIPTGNREAAVEVHQLRAGHWSGSRQYLHRIGKCPSRDCAACSSAACPAGRCPLCQEEADTPEHVLRRCPALMGLRHRLTGTISPSTLEVRSSEVVAALAAANRSLQSRLATPR